MEHYDNCPSNKCICIVGVIIGALLGAAIGILFAIGLIPNIITAAWIVLGLGVLSLIVLVVSVLSAAVTGPSPLSRCLCKNGGCLFWATLGTIISSLAMLSTVLIQVCILKIIIVAVTAFFFFWMIFGLAALILCIISKICSHHKKS